MPIDKAPELPWLLLTVALTALMFVPYVARLIIHHTFIGVIADSTSSLVNDARWALLAKKRITTRWRTSWCSRRWSSWCSWRAPRRR